ncbi:MAG: AI-2E family transporter [Saprospirales bacterium]|nr:AI-2E family transporter [Saprospirales bacterium]
MRINNRIIAIIIGVLATAAFVYFFSDIVVYVAIAWVLSLILGPLVHFFRRKLRFRKFQAGTALCAVLAMVVFLAGLLLILTLFIPLIVEQANNLAGVNYQNLASALQEPMSQLNLWLENRGLIEHQPSVEVQLQNAFKLQDWFQPAQVGNFFSIILTAAGNVLVGFFSVLFITFFFLQDETMLADFLVSILPNEYEKQVRQAFRGIDRMLHRYFSGILLQVSILTAFMAILLSIFGIQNALLIAFFAALINLIPYVGPFLGAVFGVFISISSNLDLEFYSQMLPMLGKVVGSFIAMQFLDNYILQPWIFSKSVKAHPLEIFIVILMGAQLNGVLGMVLAIPVYTVLRVVARTFWSKMRIVQSLTEGLEEEDEETGKADSESYLD